MKYDIFISYKRLGASSATAAYLYELLQQRGYNVFFDRKEMRSGKFNDQLLEHISNATDIIILLEEDSLKSWFNAPSRNSSRTFSREGTQDRVEIDTNFREDPYKTDWFCREIMHALSLEGKNIIPILLNGYNMPEGKELPPEMAELSLHNALSLEISEIEDFYEKYFIEQGYLKSKPANLSLTKRFQSKGGIVGCFLFYTDANSCDLYECGDKITTLTDDNDEWHPFRYPVNFAGEHRFKAFNNDSCEIITLRCDVETNSQKYIQVQFNDNRDLWTLTEEEINAQKDAKLLYDWGRGLFEGTSKHEPNVALSFECLRRSIDLGCEEAMDYVCSQVSSLEDNNKASGEEAFKWYSVAAKNGNENAQFCLGEAYRLGDGIEQNNWKAFLWYTKAAEHGLIFAQTLVGYMYSEGEGVEQNYEKAFEWYTKAAEQGEEIAQRLLGNMFRKGEGVEQNYEKAFEWYTKAAEQGDAIAQRLLGNMYREGEGVEQNYEKAFEWYTKAAEQGEATAQWLLGNMYSEGEGVKQDHAKAFEWYTKAAEQGDEFALNLLAWQYHLMGDYEKALPWAERAIEAAPDDPNVLDTLATVYEGLGYYKEALEQFEKCLKTYKDDGDIEGIRETKKKITALKEKMKSSK